jgi:hypothetical protein
MRTSAAGSAADDRASAADLLLSGRLPYDPCLETEVVAGPRRDPRRARGTLEGGRGFNYRSVRLAGIELEKAHFAGGVVAPPARAARWQRRPRRRRSRWR